VARPGSALTPSGRPVALLRECGSTQDIVRVAASEGAAEGFVAVTDHQTDGRGRRGRTWADEPGQSLMFSLLLRPTAPTEALAPLALVIGIGLSEALPVAARLRWPNDIVVGGAKVAGILTELETPAGGDRYVIAGVGINANTSRAALPPTDRLPATSLLVETGRPCDRLALLHDVTEGISAAYRTWQEAGFEALVDRFAALDDLAGRDVSLQLGTEAVTGRAAGIDRGGRLVVALPGGGERRLDAGEVVRVGDDAAP
jgi:BirA family transcriptional regulator, biotin operon repressor / biotin---[acetyl-CoA-carboxylase] ligase